MQLFEYVITFVPKKSDKDNSTELAKLLSGDTPKLIQAADEKTATLKIARQIPEEYAERLEQVRIHIRPFDGAAGQRSGSAAKDERHPQIRSMGLAQPGECNFWNQVPVTSTGNGIPLEPLTISWTGNSVVPTRSTVYSASTIGS